MMTGQKGRCNGGRSRALVGGRPRTAGHSPPRPRGVRVCAARAYRIRPARSCVRRHAQRCELARTRPCARRHCTRPRPVRRGGPSGPCVWPLMERDRPGARRFEATAAPPIPRSRPGRAAPCRKRRRGRSPHRASWARPAPPTGRGVLRTFRVARRKECWRLGFRWWGVGVMAPSRQRPPRFSTSLAVRRAIVRPATASSCNRLGFWLGAGAQSDVDTGPDQVHPSDLRTCEHLGRRVAFVTRQLVAGRMVSPAASFPAASSAPAR